MYLMYDSSHTLPGSNIQPWLLTLSKRCRGAKYALTFSKEVYLWPRSQPTLLSSRRYSYAFYKMRQIVFIVLLLPLRSKKVKH